MRFLPLYLGILLLVGCVSQTSTIPKAIPPVILVDLEQEVTTKEEALSSFLSWLNSQADFDKRNLVENLNEDERFITLRLTTPTTMETSSGTASYREFKVTYDGKIYGYALEE